MQNLTPRTQTALIAGANGLVRGATSIGISMGLVHNSEIAIKREIKNLTDARVVFNDARLDLAHAHSALRAAVKASRKFLMTARDTFKTRLGNLHTDQWLTTGFATSLAVEEKPGRLQVQLQTCTTYLTANPNTVVAVLEVTPARGLALMNELGSAIEAVNTAKAATKGALAARNAAEKTLRIRYRGTINEIAQSIGPRDPRWLEFGLNPPGEEKTPEVPAEVQAQSQTTGEISAQWPRPPRARYYHVLTRVVGGESAEFTFVAKSADPNITLKEQPSGAQIELCVTALNSGGESPRSPVVLVTVR